MAESAEFVADIEINGGVDDENDDKYDVARDPGQGKAIPEWSDGKIAVGRLCDIGVRSIYEGERSRE